LITHCTSAVAASKLRPIAGKATLSTEPSMNDRLEARMVVASTSRGWRHRPAGAAAEAAMARSQGMVKLGLRAGLPTARS
jgi:hypothetical protein